MLEDILVPIAGMLTGTLMVLGLPLVIVYARRMWVKDSARAAGASPETDERLERIEHAIDAMALEVERISEGQRFVTKLLADQSRERVGLPAGESRHTS